MLNTLTREIYSNEETIGILNSNIRNYKEYTFTSFIFALRLGLISMDNYGKLLAPKKISENPNIIVYAAEVLGKLFAKGDFQDFITYTGVQI